MLERIVSSFVEGMDERGFDVPFMALLRSAGFSDIHFTHGSLEFGKDFIAKRVEGGAETQYVFQSKAGNLNLSQWSDLAGQLTLLRTNELSHPAFNRRLPRRAVLIITGRLNGHAQLAAQDYVEGAVTRKETPLEVWDRERIVELMRNGLDAGLTPSAASQLLGVYGAIQSGQATEERLEALSQLWCGEEQVPMQASLSAAILALELARNKRLDLASYIGLALVRASAVQTHGHERTDKGWSVTGEIGRLIFREYATRVLLFARSEALATSADFVRAHFEPASIVTYRIRCMRTIELVGLLGLMPEMAGEREAIAQWVQSFVEKHPGTTQPPSDRWAVSLIPPFLLLVRSARRPASAALAVRVIDWLIGAHQNGSGLAGPRARPEDEVKFLLACISSPPVARRKDSYLAAAMLDLLAVLRFPRAYADASGGVRAAGIHPCAVVSSDTPLQYVLEGSQLGVHSNIRYTAQLPDSASDAGAHLAEAIKPRYLETVGRDWDQLAVSAVLRDRYFPSAWRSYL